MIPRIKELKLVENYTLLVVFDDGKSVRYDVNEDIRNIPSFSALYDDADLFYKGHLDPSSTCVIWNEDVDLPSDILYEYGRTLGNCKAEAEVQEVQNSNSRYKLGIFKGKEWCSLDYDIDEDNEEIAEMFE